jgi:Single-stranded DNA-binding protein
LQAVPDGSAPSRARSCETFKCKAMEFLNRIEIKGVVGRAEIHAFNGTRVCNFSVVTEYSTRDKDGNPDIDIAWFNVSAWQGPSMPDFYEIQKGAWIRVVGRIRIRKYTTQDNEERSVMDVLARTVEMIPREDERLQPQRDW